MIRLLISILFLYSSTVYAQTILTLDSCIALAFEQFQYNQQKLIYGESRDLAEKNAMKTWFPKMILDGNFSYQNEQISIPISAPIPGFDVPQAPLYSNKLLVNFSQNIYDGSYAASKKKLEQSKYGLLEKDIEIQQLKLKSQVISLFMGIKLSEENLKILELKKKTVEDNFNALNEAAKYGAVTKINLKVLEAELLQIDQIIAEAEFSRNALLTSLSELTGTSLESEIKLQMPEPKLEYSYDLEQRPELQLLHLRSENLELQKNMLKSTRNPKLGMFGSVGAGYPGFNVFLKEIRPMALVGMKLNWEIWDWNLVRNEKKIITLNQQIISSEQERANIQFRVELKQQHSEILKMNKLLENDAEMIALRSDISKMKATQLKNGATTSTEYITELNREEEARLNQKVHELKMILAKLNYITIQGK